LCELTIRTVEEDYFVGVDKQDKHAYLLNNSSYNKTVFKDRKTALKMVKEYVKDKKE